MMHSRWIGARAHARAGTRGPVWISSLLLASLLAATSGAAPDPVPPELAITACAFRNMPQPDSIRAVRITSRNRVGDKKVTVVRMYGRRSEDGNRQLLVRFIEPEEMRGSSLLLLERDGENEIYMASPELGKPKRILGSGRTSPLFGSDLTYEDFEHMEGFSQVGKAKLLDTDKVGDRPVYVVETRPARSEGSGYERVVSHVDKETCVALKMSFYETGNKPRKQLTTNPDWIRKRGSIWIAHMSMMEDLRDFTTTQVLVDSSTQETLPAEMFSVDALEAGAP